MLLQTSYPFGFEDIHPAIHGIWVTRSQQSCLGDLMGTCAIGDFQECCTPFS
jgi:hypothetical protein